MNMTLSSRPGFLVLGMSEQMRDRLTPSLACSTAIRFLANLLVGHCPKRDKNTTNTTERTGLVVSVDFSGYPLTCVKGDTITTN